MLYTSDFPYSCTVFTNIKSNTTIANLLLDIETSVCIGRLSMNNKESDKASKIMDN